VPIIKKKLERKDPTIEKLCLDFEQLKKGLVRKDQLLLQKEQALADTWCNLFERKKQEQNAFTA
jgi:hypothetical protein